MPRTLPATDVGSDRENVETVYSRIKVPVGLLFLSFNRFSTATLGPFLRTYMPCLCLPSAPLLTSPEWYPP